MKKSIVSVAVGSAFAASAMLAPVAQAANPFEGAKLEGGYQLAQADTSKPAPAKKADAKCGADKAKDGKCGEGKCGADKKKDGKCGEGKCGADKKASAKCGADKKASAKCGADKKAADGKCGAAKK